MSVSYPTFERLKERGLAAYQAGNFAEAKPFLMQAADAMIKIAAETGDAARRARRKAMAAELIEFAKQCDGKAAHRRQERRRAASGEGDEAGADAQDWIVRDKPTVKFDDIAGLDDVKHEIRLKMIYPFAHPELAAKYRIATGGGLLLYGPPGTGKTMIAKAVACEIDATMFVVSPAQVMSKWVGEAEQNVRKLFEAAKAEPRSIIFIDEIEAMVPSRRDSSSSVMTRVVPQILQELEGFDRSSASKPLLFVGATNEPWALDSAVMRPGRFDAKVYVPLPDEPARHRLLEIYLGSRPLADDVDFAELVAKLEGYSGADIKALAERAATIPFMGAVGGETARPIAMADIVMALAELTPSVKKKDLLRFEQFRDAN
ncbi:MAG TPA: ATP-binding protein [Phycisphaerae bacterium]|nr:ATP-binding protein [Phycisphaerae bacterium]